MQTANKLLPTVGDEVVLLVFEEDAHILREVVCQYIVIQDSFVWVTLDGGTVGFPTDRVKEINYLPKPEGSEEAQNAD